MGFSGPICTIWCRHVQVYEIMRSYDHMLVMIICFQKSLVSFHTQGCACPWHRSDRLLLSCGGAVCHKWYVRSSVASSVACTCTARQVHTWHVQRPQGAHVMAMECGMAHQAGLQLACFTKRGGRWWFLRCNQSFRTTHPHETLFTTNLTLQLQEVQ